MQAQGPLEVSGHDICFSSSSVSCWGEDVEANEDIG